MALAAITAAVALCVLLLGLYGGFSRIAASSPMAAPVPGLTVDDDAPTEAPIAPGPVVTSLRSGSAAARAGVQVGDHISAVDGQAIRNVAGLRAAIAAEPNAATLALHIQRGRAIWTVALDRVEPVRRAGQGAEAGHEPQDPAG